MSEKEHKRLANWIRDHRERGLAEKPEFRTVAEAAAIELHDARERNARLTAENARLRAALERIGKGNICESLLSNPPKCKRAEIARNALKDHPNDLT